MSVGGFALDGNRRKRTSSLRFAPIILRAWPDCQKAAASHGKRWLALNDDRILLMSMRLIECGPELEPLPLVHAIHGAVAYWRACFPEEDYTVYLTPDTVYRPSKFMKYLEAYSDPKIAPRKRWEDMTADEQREIQRKSGLIA